MTAGVGRRVSRTSQSPLRVSPKVETVQQKAPSIPTFVPWYNRSANQTRPISGEVSLVKNNAACLETCEGADVNAFIEGKEERNYR